MSYFFRANLQGSKQHTITLDKELSQVRAYLSLEQARYPGRFNININVEDKYRDVLVPPFLIQILVENAIKHAFTNRKQGNDIDVSVIKETATHVRIIVQDNGQGISKDKMHLLGETSVESESGTGSALENLNLRLKGLFENPQHYNLNRHRAVPLFGVYFLMKDKRRNKYESINHR